jgi:hypothetical protein
MKISNKKYIENLGVFLMLCILFILSALGLHFLIFKKINGPIIGSLVLLAFILIILSKLNYTEFENSGFVITVKKRHLFSGNSFVFPILEFPVQLLQKFYHKDGHLYLFVVSTNDESKVHCRRLLLYGFTQSQRTELLTLLAVTN